MNREYPLISTVMKSDIDRAGGRCDSGCFKPEYLEIEKKLNKIGSKFFSEILLEITGGATPLGANYLKNGVPFLRVQNIMENYYNTSELVFISNIHNQRIKRSCLRKNDVLLTITGSYGKSAVVDKTFENANINQHSVLMRFKDYLNPFYVSTFLNSYFGRKQSDRYIVGVTRPALNYEGINQFLIPILKESFQKEIENIIKEAHERKRQSEECYKKAEEILLKELGLLNFEIVYDLAYTATKKEVNEAERFDSEYFYPVYRKIIEKIENYTGGCCEVWRLVSWQKGTEVGSDTYTQEGFDFGRVGDFSIHGFKNTSKKISEKKFIELKKEFQPQIGEILFTKDGTLGISYLLKEQFNGIVSSAFLRLKLKEEFQGECLTLILNSILTKLQIEKNFAGAIIDHLKPNDFERIKIPLISQSIQERISTLIIESNKLRKESKNLLESAKRKIEEEIELRVSEK